MDSAIVLLICSLIRLNSYMEYPFGRDLRCSYVYFVSSKLSVMSGIPEAVSIDEP